eukprot:TRINITY_DN41320_c0_g1_i1.p1 TRINITY_DN41320_c0_g1~~TRINITY_DN41320_c0_g1_i1.p1  ORF type:complete len:407 (-),score=72.10 TRINITY_DN41320_c0_g1_i1:127-1347(-)
MMFSPCHVAPDTDSSASESDDLSLPSLTLYSESKERVRPDTIRLVPYLGSEEGAEIPADPVEREKKRSIIQHGYIGSDMNVVKCSKRGHAMIGKVAEEGFREKMHFVCSRPQCNDCGEELDVDGMRYVCEVCGEVKCHVCARHQLGLPVTDDAPDAPVELKCGDIILTLGGRMISTHHVILVLGGLKRDHSIAAILNVPPGIEVWGCDVIESTGLEKGETCWWHQTYMYFARDPYKGTAELIADISLGRENVINAAEEPVPMKVLLHPCRREWMRTMPLDEQAFRGVTADSASHSKKWSLKTAAKAYLSMRAGKESGLHVEDYSTPEEREGLMVTLAETWRKKPICASVPIKVWQMYFNYTSRTTDEAAQATLKYMPLLCDRTTPSLLASKLTSKGWVLLEGLEAK